MNQPTLFKDDPKPLPFGGKVDAIDVPRLTRHLERVREIMASGGWITLDELARKVGCLQTSASARIRDLKKPEFGGHKIEKKRSKDSDGLWLYRLIEK